MNISIANNSDNSIDEINSDQNGNEFTWTSARSFTTQNSVNDNVVRQDTGSVTNLNVSSTSEEEKTKMFR